MNELGPIARMEKAEAEVERLRTVLREIAGVWPGESGTEPIEDWRKARARDALTHGSASQ